MNEGGSEGGRETERDRTDRQRDRQTERQTDRQTDREDIPVFLLFSFSSSSCYLIGSLLVDTGGDPGLSFIVALASLLGFRALLFPCSIVTGRLLLQFTIDDVDLSEYYYY